MSWSGAGSYGESRDTRTGPMEVCGRLATPILFWTRRRSPFHEGPPPHEMAGYMNKTKGNKRRHPLPWCFRHKRGQRVGENGAARQHPAAARVKPPVPRGETGGPYTRQDSLPRGVEPVTPNADPFTTWAPTTFLLGAQGKAEVRFYSRIKRWLHRFAHRPAMRAGRAVIGLIQRIRALFWSSQVTSTFRILGIPGSLFGESARH